MSDGARLQESWSSALKRAQTRLRSLLRDSSASYWRPVPSTQQQQSIDPNQSIPLKGKGRANTGPSPSDVVVHRHGDIFRIVLEIPLVSDEDDILSSMNTWKAILSTPEMRKEYDPTVQDAHLIEMFDPHTRIAKTDFALGWPAYPRDTITISKTFNDDTTLIDISTSLPRSPDEPAYLRPAPPFVRSHIHLFAWCIQIISPHPPNSIPVGSKSQPVSPQSQSKVRITCFNHHDLNGVWGVGSSFLQNLPLLAFGLFQTVRKRGNRIPLLKGYGLGVGMQHLAFDAGREALRVEYSIMTEADEIEGSQLEGVDHLTMVKEQRRLERSVEYDLPGDLGWDVQISAKGSTDETTALPWTVHATRSILSTPASQSQEPVILRLDHSKPREHAVLRVKVVIELAGTSTALRVNGIPQPIDDVDVRDLSAASVTVAKQMLDDASSVSQLSVQTASTSHSSVSTAGGQSRPLMPTATERLPAAEKSILTLVRRNYIYFTSLLQEPDAKWSKSVTEARGVTVTQLDSIDPTLVVYKAEAVFVGIGMWDLLSVIASPGARVYWDKGFDDAALLEDVNELSELWHFKTKAAWPVNARDSVLLKTSYKSPSSAHVFSFSTDDAQLFPAIPPLDPSVIRTQVDLQGWAIEALSPNTTHLTLLEQSDPKGWSNKSSIPQQMIAALAGVGEFAIKCGGPPVPTRLGGAKVTGMRYENERSTFKLDYEGSETRRRPITTSHLTAPTPVGNGETESSSSELPPLIECELRCDMDTWSASLEIVVDPPPQSVSCLRRHRFSSAGGGLWIIISHDAIFVGDDPLSVVVRKGPNGKERGVIMMNGARTKVDVEDLPEHEIKTLSKVKRIKPQRIPLDQPPVMTALRRRRAEWEQETSSVRSMSRDDSPARPVSNFSLSAWTNSIPKFASPLPMLFTPTTPTASSSPAIPTPSATPVAVEPHKHPMQSALGALAYLHGLHGRQSLDDWTLVADKLAFPVHRKMDARLSSSVPLHKGEKVIEGASAEDIAAFICDYDSRRQWDDRFDSAVILEEYGAGSHTAFVVTKAGFPFRDRGFYVASLLARLAPPSELDETTIQSPRHRSLSMTSNLSGNGAITPTSNPTVIFCVSASYSTTSHPPFAPARCNPYNLPIGNVVIDGWILETLDPYTTTENYMIPSTRCTHVVAVDLAGSVPLAYTSMVNASLPRTILALESSLKANGKLCRPGIRFPAPLLGLRPLDEAERGIDQKGLAWQLEKVDDERAVIGSRFDSEKKLFRATVFIRPQLAPKPDTARPAIKPSSPDSTPQASQLYAFQSRRRVPSTPSHEISPSPSLLRSPSPTSPSRTLQFPSLTHRRMSSTAVLDSSSDWLAANSDFLVAEVIVDAKAFPQGYEVLLKSIMGTEGLQRQVFSLAPLDATQDSILPLVPSFFTIPPPPLLSGTTSSRQLLRLTLPTATYTAPPIEDPLTGETRHPPSRPPWLDEVEKRGAIVEIIVKPNETQRKSGMIGVNGQSFEVTNEKKSIVLLGRAQLEEGRADLLPSLVRSVEEGEKVPKQLSEPIAVARELFEDVKPPSGVVLPASDAPKGGDAVSVGEEKKEGASSTDITPSADSGLGSVSSLVPSPTDPARRPSAFDFFSVKSFPGTFPWFSSPGRLVADQEKKADDSVLAPATPNVPTLPAAPVRIRTTYPLRTVILVAIISFLVGSLLRSLLSPADFIYMSEENDDGGPWREVKRLVELKYVLGGWDFVVAVVRRP